MSATAIQSARLARMPLREALIKSAILDCDQRLRQLKISRLTKAQRDREAARIVTEREGFYRQINAMIHARA